MYLCLFFPVSLCLCPSVYLSFCLCLCLSLSLSLSLSVSLYLSASPPPPLPPPPQRPPVQHGPSRKTPRGTNYLQQWSSADADIRDPLCYLFPPPPPPPPAFYFIFYRAWARGQNKASHASITASFFLTPSLPQPVKFPG